MTDTKTLANRRIHAAQATTAAIDQGGLWPALTTLQNIGGVGNGAGCYADVRAFRSALQNAATEIQRAQAAIGATDWPTEADWEVA
jgi:hypothetical protein